MRAAALLGAILVLMVCVVPVTAATSQPRMRPYAGIGVLTLPNHTPEHDIRYSLYEAPGLSRVASLTASAFPGYEWLFGELQPVTPVIVSGRRGEWFRVVYDDAGREGWLKQPRAGRFHSWEYLLKSGPATLLPGLQNKYLQLYNQPGGVPQVALVPRRYFRVVKVEQDWAMVLPVDRDALGWLRWRDEDGRLLIGISTLADAAAHP